MEKRINEAEFDEFEKLLGEIPNVTSGPNNGTLNTKSLKDRCFYDENLSAKNIQQYEDLKLPDDQSLISAFTELSFNDTSSPVYGQYPNVPNFDYLSSLGPSLQNSFTRFDPEIAFQFVPNMPNFSRVELSVFPNQPQQCYLHTQGMYQQYLSMTPDLRSQRPILTNGSMTPHHIMSQSFRNPCDNIHFGIYNQERNKTSSVSRRFSEKMLPNSLGLNSLRNELFCDKNQTGRFLSNSQYEISSLGSYGDLKCNSVRPIFQNCNSSSIGEMVGRIYFMAKDQYGCRFLQRKFTEGTERDVEIIFNEIIHHIVELMTDPFGNYLVQKLLEVCDEDQRMQILRTITGDIIRISCDMHGTRAVQKVIETLSTPEQYLLVISSLKPALVILMKNINGNHVAQRCLQNLSSEYSELLYEAAFASCVELATDRHGCCVLQKCLSHCEGEKWHRLTGEITSNSLILSQDQYGNYLVQFVLKTRVSWAILDVLHQLEGNYGDLSMQKYSSNVIEKCLKHAKEEKLSCIIKELISDRHFDQILQDPYGNYVIQAALKRSKATLHGALVEAIKLHIPLLKTSPYGKKVLQAIA